MAQSGRWIDRKRGRVNGRNRCWRDLADGRSERKQLGRPQPQKATRNKKRKNEAYPRTHNLCPRNDCFQTDEIAAEGIVAAGTRLDESGKNTAPLTSNL